MSLQFCNANLRGRSFRGQDLTGADFSYADIRGATFTHAILTYANFSHSRAGLQQHWVVGLGLGSLFLSALSAFSLGYSGGLVGSAAAGYPDIPYRYTLISAITALTILSVFFIVTIRRGLTSTSILSVVIAIIAALFAALASIDVATVAIEQAISIAGAVAGVVLGSLSIVLATAMAGVRVLAIAGIISSLSAVIGVLFGTTEQPQLREIAYLVAGIITIALLLLSAYVGWLAWAGNSKYALIRAIAINLMTKGTSLRGADLTDANFSEAILNYTDFRSANLTRTNWFQAKQLEQARLEGTYLEDPEIRQLTITKQGHDRDFSHCNLRGLNLENAVLSDANFMGSDLSESLLRNADLSRAKLVQTQLHRADLTHACLTGAYIQDWGISTDTKLDEIRCDYVYMRLPTKVDPDPCRKPDNRQETFKPGDFSDFMAPIIKTLDLYRRQNVDPRIVAQTFKTLDLYHYDEIDPTAVAIALKQLADQYPEAELEVVALEGRGKEKVRLQTRVAGAVDRSKLSAAYFANYERKKSLPHTDLQALLAKDAEADARIPSLESMVKTAINSNTFYVETYYNLGDTMSDKSSINIQGSSVGGVVQGNISDVSGVVNLGAISGDVSNAIGQLPTSPEPDKHGLKELLIQLQEAIEAESAISSEDKADALEQVKVLATIGQNPQQPEKESLGRKAVKILKGTISSLPDTVKIVEACNTLLPLIMGALGLPPL